MHWRTVRDKGGGGLVGLACLFHITFRMQYVLSCEGGTPFLNRETETYMFERSSNSTHQETINYCLAPLTC